ncbi:MAG: hypothetical protein OH354_01570 [Candidatus Parvarchaeota archaeon]|nr:hypothetical protein [Candidatus Jingweiarchaeum tengchongense]MCW1304443.1 hypothetical protein [Candidatus Jingweiarchaeum tengchongense]MCW1305610.1 hypothetical protein [Candidatus Jingweiarchaeum tengchongense]
MVVFIWFGEKMKRSSRHWKKYKTCRWRTRKKRLRERKRKHEQERKKVA